MSPLRISRAMTGISGDTVGLGYDYRSSLRGPVRRVQIYRYLQWVRGTILRPILRSSETRGHIKSHLTGSSVPSIVRLDTDLESTIVRTHTLKVWFIQKVKDRTTRYGSKNCTDVGSVGSLNLRGRVRIPVEARVFFYSDCSVSSYDRPWLLRTSDRVYGRDVCRDLYHSDRSTDPSSFTRRPFDTSSYSSFLGPMPDLWFFILEHPFDLSRS